MTDSRAVELMSLGRTTGRAQVPSITFDWQRVLDFTLALLLLIFIAPAYLAIAAAIKMHDGGPVLFRQTRIGKNGRPFRCLKFRSMRVDAEERIKRLLDEDHRARAEWAATQKLRLDPRITSPGRFLRITSLDELPQLINVIRGEMALVGPRPIVDGERVRYGRRISEYTKVKPGITGLWQVSGRNDTTYRRRVAMDVVFVRNRSVALYLWILTMTLPVVLLRKGAC